MGLGTAPQGRKIEFLTVHKSKGLEADYVIILQCNTSP